MLEFHTSDGQVKDLLILNAGHYTVASAQPTIKKYGQNMVDKVHLQN